MSIKRILWALAAIVLFAGCFKSVSNKTNYALKPLVQQNDGESPLMLDSDSVVVYAFAADTAQWEVASYEDAAAGILTAKKLTSGTMAPIATGEPDEREGFEGWLRMSLNRSQVLILAVDTRDSIYGYTLQSVPENFSELSVVVVFKPWKKGKSYKDGNWIFHYDNYEDPKQVECSVLPQVQTDETEDPGVPANANFKVYAFSADTTAWYLASYEDAVEGKITSKENPSLTRTGPLTASKGSDGEYSMVVENDVQMVVVVDRTNEMYAYSKQTVQLGGDPVTLPQVVFRPWRTDLLYEEPGGWRVVNPGNASVDPETERRR